MHRTRLLRDGSFNGLRLAQSSSDKGGAALTLCNPEPADM